VGTVGRAQTAWVNLLSVYALVQFSAARHVLGSKAAALSLAQCLRAEMRAAGVRVINVLPDPSTMNGIGRCRRRR